MIPDYISKIDNDLKLNKSIDISGFAYVFYAHFSSFEEAFNKFGNLLGVDDHSEYSDLIKDCTVYQVTFKKVDSIDIDKGIVLMSKIHFRSLWLQQEIDRDNQKYLLDISLDRFRRKYFFWTTTILFLVGILLWVKNIYFFHL